MRITAATDYEEPRDSLAQDWTRFMSTVVPETTWVGIPNLGRSALDFVKTWSLDALILTGGDEIGATPLRDETERVLLDHFIGHGKPVFGVCRGMQLIQTAFGGQLSPCNSDAHVANHHIVRFVTELSERVPGVRETTVNSFHSLAIASDATGDGIEALAITDDGYVEAFSATSGSLLAVMWHPEREPVPNDVDRRLIRHVFGLPLDASAPDLET